jgi:hypothetical protein
MDGDDVLLVLLGLALLGVILKVRHNQSEERENTRRANEEQRLLNEERDRQFRNKQEEAKEELLRKRNQTPPYFVRQAIRDFMAEYGQRVRSGHFDSNLISPLTYFGYRVGVARGRPENERKRILEITLFSEIPEIFPTAYRREWGPPASPERLTKICKHIENNAARRASRPNYATAVREWRKDASWFKENFEKQVKKYRKYQLA